MVYLVWFRSPGRNETLLGVWQGEDEARKHCETVALGNAEGSGRITESMMGDSWEVQNPRRETFSVRFEQVAFGMVGD